MSILKLPEYGSSLQLTAKKNPPSCVWQRMMNTGCCKLRQATKFASGSDGNPDSRFDSTYEMRCMVIPLTLAWIYAARITFLRKEGAQHKLDYICLVWSVGSCWILGEATIST